MLQGPAYRLCTARLQLECAAPTDAHEMHAVVCAERVRLAEHLVWAREEPLAFDVRLQVLRTLRARFDQSVEYVWTMREGERFVGMVGLHPSGSSQARSIGYWLRAAACGRGLATEAVCAVLVAAFEVEGAEQVEIHTAASNVRSLQLAARLGFVRNACKPGSERPLSTADEPADLELHVLRRSAAANALRRATAVVALDVLGRKLFDSTLLRPSVLSAR